MRWYRFAKRDVSQKWKRFTSSRPFVTHTSLLASKRALLFFQLDNDILWEGTVQLVMMKGPILPASQLARKKQNKRKSLRSNRPFAAELGHHCGVAMTTGALCCFAVCVWPCAFLPLCPCYCHSKIRIVKLAKSAIYMFFTFYLNKSDLPRSPIKKL